jgi:hypothetical protein
VESPNPADVDTRSRQHFFSLTVSTGLFGMNFGWMVDHIGTATAVAVLAIAIPVVLLVIIVVAAGNSPPTEVAD